jgi:conserved protein with predicted RNA binding PUA domain
VDPLPLNPNEKINYHISAIFAIDVPHLEELSFEYSRRTGRIKSLSIRNKLVATLRRDGGIALTIFGAQELLKNRQFRENCVIPTLEALSFVSEGRSLFCKHVRWCGSNVKVGSDVAIIDNNDNVLAVGKAILGATSMKAYQKGVAVKVREGIKSRMIK